MARKYSELRQKLTPDGRAAAKEKTREMLNEMLLGELRRLSGKTQSELAEALGIRQPTLSRLEAQDDMQISTLQRIVRALGGELEIIARMPHGNVTIRQFDDAAA